MEALMSSRSRYQDNVQALRTRFPDASQHLLSALRQLTIDYDLSINAGELQLISGRWYVTHAGLLKIAHRNHCSSIEVDPAPELNSPRENRWVFRASVRKKGGRQVFVGYGDADPHNISSSMHGAELRIAETRAVNRALRKAYGIGLCSAEELAAEPTSTAHGTPSSANAGGNGHVKEMRVRNRLITLIRRHELDSAQVKSYAAEFCRTDTLRDADQNLVRSFVDKLETWAKEDLHGLREHLARYTKPEVREVA
jgi:hypothetical protein